MPAVYRKTLISSIIFITLHLSIAIDKLEKIRKNQRKEGCSFKTQKEKAMTDLELLLVSAMAKSTATIPQEAADIIHADPRRFERHLSQFLNNGGILAPNMILPCPVPQASDFLMDGWAIGHGQTDQRADSLGWVDVGKLEFWPKDQTEKHESGRVRISRLYAQRYLLHGIRLFGALLKDWQELGEFSILGWLRAVKGITCINFAGSVIEHKGRQYVLYLRHSKERDWRGWAFRDVNEFWGNDELTAITSY
ncbi:hypothetical protein KKG36_00690 [Patescibacteria group bacterium]|nr:hypothetical protein [Patescibacteria group bacterium]